VLRHEEFISGWREPRTAVRKLLASDKLAIESNSIRSPYRATPECQCNGSPLGRQARRLTQTPDIELNANLTRRAKVTQWFDGHTEASNRRRRPASKTRGGMASGTCGRLLAGVVSGPSGRYWRAASTPARTALGEFGNRDLKGPVRNMSTATTWPTAAPGMETRFVDADFFCRLVTSRRCLERMDDHAQGLRGVFDPITCVHYVVEERKLVRSRRPNRLAGRSVRG